MEAGGVDVSSIRLRLPLSTSRLACTNTANESLTS